MLSTRRSQLGEKRQATVVNSWQFKGSEALGDQCGRREQKAWAHHFFFLLVPSAKIMRELELFYKNNFYLLCTIQSQTHSIYCIFRVFWNSFRELSRPLSILCWHHCSYPTQPVTQACWFLLKHSNPPEILSYSMQDFLMVWSGRKERFGHGVCCFVLIFFGVSFLIFSSYEISTTYKTWKKTFYSILSKLQQYTSSSAQRVQNNLKHDRWAPFMRLTGFVL